MRDIRLRRWMMGFCVLALAAHAGPVAGAARATGGLSSPDSDAGAWDLTFEKGNRRCRLILRADESPPGYALAMPAGCHRAFPILATVTNWAPGTGNHVVLRTAAGQPAIDFGHDGGPSLSALVGEEGTYVLTPTDQARQESLANARAQPVPEPPPEAAMPASHDAVMVDSKAPAARAKAKGLAEAAALPPVTAGEVAGHYAVLRDTRDTGCMVTLEAEVRGKAELKAKLAPACRDQGIVIFDPVGWRLVKGELVLTAKRGHSTALTHVQSQTWANAPVKGAALVLKRL